MPFNMNKAWDEAIRLLRANRELVAIVIALFVFLPPLLLAVIAPEAVDPPDMGGSTDAMAQVSAHLNRNGIWLVLLQVAQGIGMLSVVALFAQRRPTVGQAIKLGLIALLPLILAQLFVGLVLSVFGGLALGAASTAGRGAQLLALLLFMAGGLFVFTRVSLLMPVLIYERQLNPFRALVDSWRLTAGRWGKILGFLFLLLLVISILSYLVGGLGALLGALVGDPDLSRFVVTGVNAAFSALWSAVIAAVLVAIYRQVRSGDDTQTV